MIPVASQLALLPESMLPQGMGSAPPSPQQLQSWLREFEHARWMAQPRFEPDGQPARDEGRADAPSAPPARVLSPPVLEAQPVDARRQEPAVEPVHTLLAMRAALGGSALGRLQRPLPAPATPALPAAAANRPRAPSPADAPADRTEPVDRTAGIGGDPACPQRLVHVFVGEGSTTVWIRDARLKPQDAWRVLNELEIDAAAAGTRRQAIHLSLNGRPVKRSEP